MTDCRGGKLFTFAMQPCREEAVLQKWLYPAQSLAIFNFTADSAPGRPAPTCFGLPAFRQPPTLATIVSRGISGREVVP
jgi:hypothetical protein